MKKRISDSELLDLIQVVKAKKAGLPDVVTRDSSTLAAYFGAADAAVEELVKNHGARLTRPRGEQRLSMAGVATTCTHGSSGLLTNWINAAYRELDRRRLA